MNKYYIVYSHKLTFKADSAHEIHDVICADAAANLGYSTVLAYPNSQTYSSNPIEWLRPFQPQKPTAKLVDFFNITSPLQVARLPLPFFTNRVTNKFTNPSTIVCKYYFPVHILPFTQAVHTRDWNFAKAAIKHQVPTVYERHYYQKQALEPEYIHSPYLKAAVTQSEPIRQSLIEAGMPPEKTLWLDNGFESSFLERQPEAAAAWREKLLGDQRQHLVIYSGSLHKFKGIEVLINAAKHLPFVQFAFTGGTPSQVDSYRQMVQDLQLDNVEFLGWILPRSRLISLLQAADVLAHPHCAGQAATFTNPVKFFQYMAAGVPIAVSEIEPLMRFKNTPVVAQWCPPDNPAALAESIRHLLEQYPYKPEGYAQSIDYAQNFSWENRAAKIMSYLQI